LQGKFVRIILQGLSLLFETQQNRTAGRDLGDDPWGDFFKVSW
jgi:hypothetical protein